MLRKVRKGKEIHILLWDQAEFIKEAEAISEEKRKKLEQQ